MFTSVSSSNPLNKNENIILLQNIIVRSSFKDLKPISQLLYFTQGTIILLGALRTRLLQVQNVHFTFWSSDLALLFC